MSDTRSGLNHWLQGRGEMQQEKSDEEEGGVKSVQGRVYEYQRTPIRDTVTHYLPHFLSLVSRFSPCTCTPTCCAVAPIPCPLLEASTYGGIFFWQPDHVREEQRRRIVLCSSDRGHGRCDAKCPHSLNRHLMMVDPKHLLPVLFFSSGREKKATSQV
jgi:hypothetical protein